MTALNSFKPRTFYYQESIHNLNMEILKRFYLLSGIPKGGALGQDS